ncbi:type IV pilin [Halegenticoccus tardaugens]|uniref:type IV pilin n=1 Tax=Halegenticoccus tardaugens TaxID=2071624 RepID=UPI00100A6675|nr:type IV pilin [Halegenticoccus tardaugens]
MSFPSSSRAVSPVVGGVLLLAVVIALAAVLAAITTGFGSTVGDPQPQIRFDAAYVPSGEGNDDDRPYVLLTHEAGDVGDGERLFVVDDDGNRIAWADIYLGGPEAGAGDRAHVDGVGSDGALNPICEAGREYRVVWEGDRGSYVVATVEIDRAPDSPSGAC